MAQKNHYPAIDVLQSMSRVMSSVASQEHKILAGKRKEVMATYADAEDLINIGAYKEGSNPSIDYAIEKIQLVNEFLKQETHEKFSFDEVLQQLDHVFQS